MSPCPTISVASRDGGDKTDLAELDADWRGESERNEQTVFFCCLLSADLPPLTDTMRRCIHDARWLEENYC